jgi:hypothetical protein
LTEEPVMAASDALIVFPHQLFESNVELISRLRRVFLVEDPLYVL